MKIVRKTVPSSDGRHTLQGIVYVPDGEIKGLVQVVHGMCEYMGRYEAFMTFLAENGYLAFGHDHLGHGLTADPKDWGFIAERDGWKYLVRDVTEMKQAVVREYGDKPWYLFGHSMGSFIVRCAAAEGARPCKLIVCGTGGPNPASGAGLLLCRTIGLLRGRRHVAALVNKMAFGAYNKRFREENDPYAWLSKDLGVRDKYRVDPMCIFPFTVSAMQDLITLQARCNKKAAFAAFPQELPVLLIAGTEDPVGEYGKGVRAVYEALRARGCRVQMKLYDNCRHEILNDTCREQTRQDVLTFLAAED